MRYLRGIDVRAVCQDGAGHVLLITGADGRAQLPGGAVGHGQHPADALTRWVAEQTGVEVQASRPLRVVTEVDRNTTRRGAWVHRDTIVYTALPAAGPAVALPGEPSASRWVSEASLAELALASGTARALGLAAPTTTGQPPTVPWSAVPGTSGRRRQRFAAYGHVTDPGGNVLLTLISNSYPGAGHWHLPGGGTDFGEEAEAGLAREIVEETGQHGEIGELLRVSHRHHMGTDPRRRAGVLQGPETKPVDWHGVRVIYAVRVPAPTTPRVVERHGSTSAAAWFPVNRARELFLSEVAREALSLP